MKAVKNMQVLFADSKTFSSFEVPNILSSVKSFDFTGIRFNKAGLLFEIFSACRRYECLATFRKSLASFVIPILQVFSSRMPNTPKNLNRTAPGASASTASPRKRAIKPYSTLKSEERQSLQHLYKVKLYGIGAWRPTVDMNPEKAEIHFSDNYSAASTYEAAGMAILAMQKEHPQYNIVLRSVKCSLLNAASAL